MPFFLHLKPHFLNVMRLNKYIAHSGIASRRHSEDLIVAGRVAVNGEIVESLSVKVQPDIDHITLDGHPIKPTEERYYYLLNKPTGYITTVTDPYNRETVMSLIHKIPHRVFPVGRLDRDSEGILLFTNDGELSFELMHPSFGVDKEYHVLVQGRPSQEIIQRLRDGLPIGGRMTAPCLAEIRSHEKNTTWLTMTLHEGRKRQIRHMCGFVGYPVIRLIRVRFGPFLLDNLSKGEWRPLHNTEILKLKKQLLKN